MLPTTYLSKQASADKVVQEDGIRRSDIESDG